MNAACALSTRSRGRRIVTIKEITVAGNDEPGSHRRCTFEIFVKTRQGRVGLPLACRLARWP
jgi:hypothetical protein